MRATVFTITITFFLTVAVLEPSVLAARLPLAGLDLSSWELKSLLLPPVVMAVMWLSLRSGAVATLTHTLAGVVLATVNVALIEGANAWPDFILVYPRTMLFAGSVLTVAMVVHLIVSGRNRNPEGVA